MSVQKAVKSIIESFHQSLAQQFQPVKPHTLYLLMYILYLPRV